MLTSKLWKCKMSTAQLEKQETWFSSLKWCISSISMVVSMFSVIPGQMEASMVRFLADRTNNLVCLRWHRKKLEVAISKVTIRPGLTGRVPVWRCMSRCPDKIVRDARMSRFGNRRVGTRGSEFSSILSPIITTNQGACYKLCLQTN